MSRLKVMAAATRFTVGLPFLSLYTHVKGKTFLCRKLADASH